jgi:hypothetical protein
MCAENVINIYQSHFKDALNCQVLNGSCTHMSVSKSWHDELLNKAPSWQGKMVNFLPYTQANKTCQGKLARLYMRAYINVN